MTTYYVDGAVGNDGNLGTSEGAGNAWATLGHAFSSIAAGDKIWIKASATYDELVTLTVSGATPLTPIRVEGYTSTPGDGGKVTWTNTGAGFYCLDGDLIGQYYIFENIIFTGASNSNINDVQNTLFINCETNNAGAAGANVRSTAWINCIFSGNSSVGLTGTSGQFNLIGCIIRNNGGSGIGLLNGQLELYRSLVYGNTTTSYAVGGGDFSYIAGCTIDGNGTTGACIDGGGESIRWVRDCIIHNAATGYTTSNTTADVFKLISYVGGNLITDSVTTPLDLDPVWIYGDGSRDIIGVDPAFTDEINNDYTLSDTSPAINAGIQPGSLS